MFFTLKPSVAKVAVRLASSAFLTFFALSTPAFADVVFSNLGPGNSYSADGGPAIAGGPMSEPGYYSEWASAFTPSGGFSLTQIDVAITNSSAPNSVMLSLDQSSGGLPGGTIESWTVTDLPVFFTTSNIVQTLIPVSPVSLVSGTEYWLVASVAPGATVDVWNSTIAGPSAPTALNLGSGWSLQLPSGGPYGAFDVLGSAIPEPSTWAMMMLGFAGLGFVGYHQTLRSKLQA